MEILLAILKLARTLWEAVTVNENLYSCWISELYSESEDTEDAKGRYCKSIGKISEGNTAVERILDELCDRGKGSSATAKVASKVVMNNRKR